MIDGVDILCCFKCKGFNHKASECKNNEVCVECLEDHKTNECNKERINKCINCERANEKLKLDLDENHNTRSK